MNIPHGVYPFIHCWLLLFLLLANISNAAMNICFNSVQFSHLVVSDSATPWIAARQASLYITNSRSPPKPMSIKSVMPSNHLILCYALLQCRKVKRESEVAQSCLTLHDPMDWSLPGSSIHEIFQARALEWVPIAFSTMKFWKFLCFNIKIVV